MELGIMYVLKEKVFLNMECKRISKHGYTHKYF